MLPFSHRKRITSHSPIGILRIGLEEHAWKPRPSEALDKIGSGILGGELRYDYESGDLKLSSAATTVQVQ
jgi:hypothetical protein